MALKDILRRVSNKTGLPYASEGQRQHLLDIINEACREVYAAQDYIGCLRECVVPIVANTCVALPSFVGQLRALREYETTMKWTLSSMRPRYHETAWTNDSIRTWREVGIRPIALDLTNIAPPVAIVAEVDSIPLTLTIKGATETANNVVETVTLDQNEVPFQTPFMRYDSIIRSGVSKSDTIIRDASDRDISLIYNNELEARFKIVDVSSHPISPIDSSGQLLMEILYKMRLNPLVNDTDEFTIPDFEDVIINKAVQLDAEDRGNVEKAAMNDKKAERTADRLSNDAMKGKETRIDTPRHPHDELFSSLKHSRYARR